MKIQFARQLRANQTDAEKKMWFILRNRRFANLKFRRQRPIGPFIADFCCIEKKLVIELDGGQHLTKRDYDRERTRYLNGKGFRVMRFWNHDVLFRTELVMEEIWRRTQEGEIPSP